MSRSGAIFNSMRTALVAALLIALPAAADTIEFNDGTRRTVDVVQQEPGKSITILLDDGSTQTISWSEIRRLTLSPEHGEALRPPARPRGGTNYFIAFGIGGFFSYGRLRDGAASYGGGPEFTLRPLLGLTRLPDESGGLWHAAFLEAYGQFTGAGVPNGNASGGLLLFNGGVGLGYSFLRLGVLEPDGMQAGWGLFAAWRAGAQHTSFVSANTASTDDFSHGPTFGVLFPKYRRASDHLKFGYVNTTISFVKDSTFFQIVAGGTF